MKLKLTLVILVIPILSFGQNIGEKIAEKVAKNFLSEKHFSHSGRVLKKFEFEEKKKLVKLTEENSFFVFNTRYQSGYVIVSSNKGTYPILAYSLTGSFMENEMPESVKQWMNEYNQQIKSIDQQKSKNKKTEETWNKYLNENFDTYLQNKITNKAGELYNVAPLLSTTWNQGVYYNAMCPTCSSGGSGGHVWAGCVATAQAQVMKYFNYPDIGEGEHSYTHSVYGLQSANFGATSYNWAGMPNALSSHNSEIAQLLYHCGVSVNMNYSPTGSGAYGSSARNSLVNYFKYSSNSIYTSKDNYTNDNWKKLLKSEIDAGHPLFYTGYGSGGHAFVCDGYQDDDFFHFNWGWGGAYDGYFYIDDLTPGSSNFTSSQSVIAGVIPSIAEEKFDSTNAIQLNCGSPYNGNTADGFNLSNQYQNTYWQETGKEKIHKITITFQGRITAKISNTNGQDLDVFILNYANRQNCLASGDTAAILDNADPGEYYIVVDGRYGAEGNYTLEIICPDEKADLVIESAQIRPSMINAGGNGELLVLLKNIGNSNAPASIMKYYLSDDAKLDLADLDVGNSNIKSLDTKESTNIVNLISVPEGISEGTKYIIINIDADNEVNETDEIFNTFAIPIQIPSAGSMDCANAIQLLDGIKYQGNSQLNGDSLIDNYQCYYGLTNKEVIHTFTPGFSGMANIEFSENLEGTMNLLVMAGCNENACLNVFELYHTSDTILNSRLFVSAGIEYFLIVDGTNSFGNSEGPYSIKINLPEECPSPPLYCSGVSEKCIGDPASFLYSDWEYSSYQWKKNGVPITGETNSSYSTLEPGSYNLEVIENGCAGESETLQINYSEKPSPLSITNLSDTIFCQGGNVALELNTDPSYTYQWTRDNEAIAGETGLELYAAISGIYRAEVTNISCTVKSNPINVIVNHSAADHRELIEMIKDSLISYWPFDNWGNDESGNLNYAGIMANQTKDKNGNLSAFYFNGIDNYMYTNNLYCSPDTFTIALWFKSETGGKLIGFDEQRFNQPSMGYDRHIYMDKNGILYYGVEDNTKYTIKSTKSYLDNQWHHLAASLSPDGMKLFIDGLLVAENYLPSKGKPINGYWKLAQGELDGWPGEPDFQYYKGNIDDVAIYNQALNLNEIELLYQDQWINIYAEKDVFCENTANPSIIIENSEPGISYQLIDADSNNPVGGPVTGNAGTINIESGVLNSSTKLMVLATNTKTLCTRLLDSIYEIHIGEIIIPEVTIISAAQFEEFCKGDTLAFQSAYLYGGDNPEFEWFINGLSAGNQSIDFYSNSLQDGDKIMLQMSSSFDCADSKIATSNIISVIIHPLPEINLGNDTSISSNESIILDAGEGFISYEWNTGEITQQIQVNGTIGIGEYIFSAKVSNQYTCLNSDSIIISIIQALAVEEINKKFKINIYPNPAADFIEFEYLNHQKGKLQVELIDNKGNIIYRKQFIHDGNRLNERFILSGISKGIYYLRFIQDQKAISIPFILK
jgi:hypothetical protein